MRKEESNILVLLAYLHISMRIEGKRLRPPNSRSFRGLLLHCWDGRPFAKKVEKIDVSPKVCRPSSEHQHMYKTLLCASKSVLFTAQSVPTFPEGRDVLLYAEGATFHNPDGCTGTASCFRTAAP